jgi:hypothetical protein
MYADSDWAQDPDSRRSIVKCIVIDGTPVTYYSRGQNLVTESTMAAEYIAVSTATDDGMLLLKLLDELGILVRPKAVLCDDVAATNYSPTRSRTPR